MLHDQEAHAANGTAGSPPMTDLLTADTVGDFLRARGVVDPDAPLAARELGGGISNVVLLVETPGDALVVKQSLPKLRVADDWPFDRQRIVNEHRALRYLEQILPAGSVPGVRFTDDEAYAFGMDVAPPGGVLWKTALLRGDVDLPTAGRAGALLALVHGRSATDPEARTTFGDQTVLVQGRVDPYHRTTAERHPEVAELIHAEVDRLLATRRALVLGDYAPKNAFAYPGRVLVLDLEVTHYGDPAFDVAFCLNHLLLKAVHRPQDAARYVAAARAFVEAYAPDAATEAATVRELGCLLLARIDGKSPVEYLTGEAERERVRGLAIGVLRSDAERLDPVLEAVA
jgi:5-methylthioribose kinase